jgi:hypothetical protein
MRTHLIRAITIVVLCAGTAANAKYSGGTGDPNDPYKIATAQDMQQIGANSSDWNKHFILVNNVNLARCTQFNIIGTSLENPFQGVFDGNDHKVLNFTWTSTGRNYIGLFGYVVGQVKNLAMENVNVNSGTGYYVGGLVGSNWGTITNCYSTGSVTGDYYVGGLVGINSDTITNCYATGSVSGEFYVSGLVGQNYGTITNCYSTGSVSGYSGVGGLVGDGGGVVNSFWDIQTSGRTTSAGGSGKTTAEMKTASTYFGWNGCGEIIWTINEGSDYPRLLWECKPGQPLPQQQVSDFLEGSGTQDDPYRVSTAEQLNLIGLFTCEWDKHFILVNNVNLAEYTGTQFNIIGTYETKFTGIFDGNDHKVWNFTWTSTGESSVGLFGCVGGQVKNLTMENVNVNVGTGMYVGGLVGINSGTITNCYSTGSVTGSRSVGGLVGYNYSYSGTITNCYSTGSVSVTGWSVGGLVGYNEWGTITNCYSTGSVTGGNYVGGLVGNNDYYGTITNCYSTGSVSGTGDVVGGLVGINGRYSYGTITNCYSTGSVSGGDSVGGLVGETWGGTVTASFWDKDTSGQTTSAGGIPKTTVEMKTKSTFTDAPAGWDFVNIWDICEATNYPRLRWQIPAADFLCPYGVGFADFAVLSSAWQTGPNDSGWDSACDISNPKDSVIDELDLAVFCENWLEEK